jgi:hypothetical protein
MLRRLEMTEEVMVLEPGRRQKQAVKEHAEKDEPLQPWSFSEQHLS